VNKSANVLDKALAVVASLMLLFFVGLCLENYLNDTYHLRARRRAVRPIARELSRDIQHDVRFTNINVSILDLGDKGPLYIGGAVQSDADLDELHRTLDSLHPPPSSVDWSVLVVSNENASPN
jgi:hypothetical protein